MDSPESSFLFLQVVALVVSSIESAESESVSPFISSAQKAQFQLTAISMDRDGLLPVSTRFWVISQAHARTPHHDSVLVYEVNL